MLSPPRRRRAVTQACEKLVVSQRRACRVLGQPRSTQRRTPYVLDDEPRLIEQIVDLASQYGRYGYRRITGLLRAGGWKVNHKRVERLWRREGLKVPAKGHRHRGQEARQADRRGADLVELADLRENLLQRGDVAQAKLLTLAECNPQLVRLAGGVIGNQVVPPGCRKP